LGHLDFALLQPFASGAANHFMRGGFSPGQMQRHAGAADFILRALVVLTQTSVSLRFSAESAAISAGSEITFDQVPTLVSPQKERSVTDGGHAFFNEIAVNFPKPQRRKEEAVSRLNFGGFVIIRYRARRYGGRLVRFSQPTFRPRVLKRLRLSRPALINDAPFS
jgi:hypothetical protein